MNLVRYFEKKEEAEKEKHHHEDEDERNAGENVKHQVEEGFDPKSKVLLVETKDGSAKFLVDGATNLALSVSALASMIMLT